MPGGGYATPAVQVTRLYQEGDVKKVLAVFFSVMMIAALASLVACKGKSGGDAIVGTWVKTDDPGKEVKITKEGDKFFYEGSQGKVEAAKQDENTLLVQMGPIPVTVKLDPATGMLGVAFMGENYQYKKKS